MSNYENIKPYADFAHTAAQHGGVDNYLNQIADSNYSLGVMNEKRKDDLKALIIGSTVLALWEGGKWLYRKGHNLYEARCQEKIQQSNAAKEAIRKGIKHATSGSDNEATSIEEETTDIKMEEELL
jgi:hypothetical protein